MIKLYKRGALIIRMILMDMEFEKADELLENVEVNIDGRTSNPGGSPETG